MAHSTLILCALVMGVDANFIEERKCKLTFVLLKSSLTSLGGDLSADIGY